MVYCLKNLESELIKFLNLLDDLKNCEDKGEMNDLIINFDLHKEALQKILSEVGI